VLASCNLKLALFCCSYPAINSVRKTGVVGALNWLPLCAQFGQSLVWVSFGFVIMVPCFRLLFFQCLCQRMCLDRTLA
jgi:tetrahydromethanopterin S-methyltransferase subunit E